MKIRLVEDEEILCTPPHSPHLRPQCRGHIGSCPELASKDGSNSLHNTVDYRSDNVAV